MVESLKSNVKTFFQNGTFDFRHSIFDIRPFYSKFKFQLVNLWSTCHGIRFQTFLNHKFAIYKCHL